MNVDLAVGAVTAMAGAALAVGIKLLMDLLGTSTRRLDEEIARLEHRHETERAEWHAERAELRSRIASLERAMAGSGER